MPRHLSLSLASSLAPATSGCLACASEQTASGGTDMMGEYLSLSPSTPHHVQKASSDITHKTPKTTILNNINKTSNFKYINFKYKWCEQTIFDPHHSCGLKTTPPKRPPFPLIPFIPNPSSLFFSFPNHSKGGSFVDSVKTQDYHPSEGSAWRTSEGWRALSPVIMAVSCQLSDWSQGPLGTLSKEAALLLGPWTALHRGQRLITSGPRSTLQLKQKVIATLTNKNMKYLLGKQSWGDSKMQNAFVEEQSVCGGLDRPWGALTKLSTW